MLIRGVVSSPIRGVVGSPVLSGGFSLAAFMASQSDGFWYDFTKTDRLFQEDVGPTPADDPNEVIGLALSQRLWGGKTLAQVVAEASAAVADSFTDASSAPGTASWSAGDLTLTALSGGTARGRLSYTVTPGVYAVTWRRTGGTSDATLDIGVTAGGSTLAAGQLVSAVARTVYVSVTGTALWLNFYRGAVNSAVVSEISVKRIGGQAALQATTSFKPKYQTAGAAFDGTDDNLLTGYTAGSGANFLIAKVKVPASISVVGIISGAINSGAGRFWLGIDTAGRLIGGVGNQSLSTIIGTSDLRGRTATVALSADGGLVRLFADNALEYEGAQTGTPSSVNPFRIGALSDSVATTFFGGSIEHVLAGREFIDLARFIQIANALGV